MPVRLFVGNLPYGVTEAQLREYFSSVAMPSHISMPVDRATGRPRGFAFVEFGQADHAQQAIQRFHGQPFQGRPLSVSEARAREDRPPGGFGGPPRMPRPDSGGLLPSSDRPVRTFGPPAPSRRQRGSSAPPIGRKRKEETRPKGPIRERNTGRVFSVDDAAPDATDDLPADFDNFATSRPEDHEDKEE